MRVALWNASGGAFKTFLNVTEEDLASSLQTNISAPFAFSRQAVLTFQKNEIDSLGRRGTLLFTGATASLRGNVYTSSFAAGKFALRALSQSLSKEFGKENIHVSVQSEFNSSSTNHSVLLGCSRKFNPARLSWYWTNNPCYVLIEHH